MRGLLIIAFVAATSCYNPNERNGEMGSSYPSQFGGSNVQYPSSVVREGDGGLNRPYPPYGFENPNVQYPSNGGGPSFERNGNYYRGPNGNRGDRYDHGRYDDRRDFDNRRDRGRDFYNDRESRRDYDGRDYGGRHDGRRDRDRAHRDYDRRDYERDRGYDSNGQILYPQTSTEFSLFPTTTSTPFPPISLPNLFPPPAPTPSNPFSLDKILSGLVGSAL